MTTDTFRILAIDDHPIVLQGIQALATSLDNVSCITKSDIRLEELPADSAYDLCILDLGICGKQSGDVIARLRSRMPACRILVYTMHEEPWIANELSALDVEGAVSKNSPLNELREAIHALRDGRRYYDLRPTDAPEYLQRAHLAGDTSAEAYHERPEQCRDCPDHEPQHQHHQDTPKENHAKARGQQRHATDEQNQQLSPGPALLHIHKSSTTSTGQWSDP